MHTPSVLVVFADSEVRSLICDFLAHEGLHARGAETAADTQAAVAAARFDVVIAECMPPDRWQPFRAALKTMKTPAPLLLITSRGDPLAPTYGAAAVLEIPFGFDALLNTVRRLAGGPSP